MTSESERLQDRRLTVLDSLRGLAALAVCFFHFGGREDLLPGSHLQAASRHGYLGVIAFFVISGFVLPWSLHRSGYRFGNFFRFMQKRLLRLEPPFLVALASVVGFVAVYHWVKELPFPPNPQWWLQVGLHVGYLTRFFGFAWLNDLYWTLAVEFQFYLLIGIVFPFLSHRRVGIRWSACAGLTAIGFSALALPYKMFVFSYLPVFMLGILTYQRRIGLLKLPQFVIALPVVGAVCYLTLGGPIALTAIVSAIVITTLSDGWKPLNQLGLVSYSLYLFHMTIGGAIISFGIKHTESTFGRYLVLIAALLAALIVAIVMYWLVERPARRWSSRVRYSPGETSDDEASSGNRILPHFVRWCLGLAQAETQTTEAERDCIVRYATSQRRLAAIGVWHGVTTARLRQAMAPDGVLLAIDPFQPGRLGFSTQRLIARKSVAAHRVGKVEWLRTTGANAATEPTARRLGGIDFVFIDGDHSYEGLRGDWEAWSPLIVPGGCVALHDSCSTPTNQIDDAGSVIFTNEIIRTDSRFEVVEVVDTLTVLRRKVAG